MIPKRGFNRNSNISIIEKEFHFSKGFRVSLFLSFIFLTLVLFFIFIQPSTSQEKITGMQVAGVDVSSIKSGLWSDGSTWSTGIVPKAGDSITIAAGHTVTYDVLSDEIINDVTIDGTLYFSRTTNTRLKTNGNIMVQANGFLDMGTASDFIPKNVKVEIIWNITQAQADAFVGGPPAGSFTPADFQLTDKGLWVFPTGRWEVHGAPLVRTWSKLAQDANAGVTDVVVENDVTDWYIGGTVVFSSTRSPREYYITSAGSERIRWKLENELKTIQDLEKLTDGKTKITLSQPLQFKHDGVSPLQGEVALLTRNILFKTELSGTSEGLQQSDVRERKYAHTEYMASSKGNLQYAEFKYMGHYGTLSRYATHHHRMLDSSRGMIIRGISGWYNGFRCTNIHITHGVLLEDNVCYNSQSTSFFVEQDDSFGFNEDNVFVHNLAVGTTNKHAADRNTPSIPGEFWRYASFWPGAKTTHEAFLGNVAGGVSRGGGSGFHFPEGGNKPRSQGTIPFTFVSNEAHSVDEGILTWQNAVPSRELVGSLLWRNGKTGITWGAYGAEYKFYNAQILENAQFGIKVTSVNTFLQDSVVTGTTVDNSIVDTGFRLGAYVNGQYPGNPVWIVRNTFKDLKTHGIGQIEAICTGSFELSLTERPVLRNDCSAFYTVQMGNTFQNVGTNLFFGMVSNPNSWAKVFDYTDSTTLPKDFVMLRKDLLDPANQGVITKELVNAQTFYSAEVDALVTPMSSLPSSVDFTGLLNARSLALQSHAAPPYEVTVDLSNLPDPVNMPSRKYAYIYARAFDGTRQIIPPTKTPSPTWGYEQRAYSNVVVIGPEVLLLGQALPPPPADTTPPNRFNGQPTGSLTSGTTQTTISLTTNEAATCKFSTTAGVDYDSMPNSFTTTGVTSHSTLITGLSDGNRFTYNVRCNDTAGNKNTNDFKIEFSIMAKQICNNGDVNNDGNINVLDLILIGQSFGITGNPGFIPEDVNCDGIVNVLDMIVTVNQF